jgi:histidine triad (HIT) family protein
MSSIFTRIIEREIPADIVHEDELSIVFKDIHPVAPFHVLVVPKRPLVNVGAASDDDAALLGHLLGVCRKVAEAAGHKDFRVITNSGAGAGQTVFHLHLHVLAGRPLSWPPG